ncbi:Hypothetical protein GSB_155479 [Giardia duodenalis]|uniref:Uncharacterized protein n=1 Tax=Giardia intestinalis TaxID=5741 RepID=V6TNM5_GIAIN|nr:Hypothetical protein GSB_155479 [Giardia intestinalis]
MAHVSAHQIVPEPLPQGRQQPWEWVCIVLDTASEGTPNCQACSEDLRTLEYLPCNNDKKLGPTKQCEPDPQCPRDTTARRVLQRRLQGAPNSQLAGRFCAAGASTICSGYTLRE